MTDTPFSTDLPPLPQRVESARLVIRPSTRADAPALQSWWNDPEVMGPGGQMDGMQYDEDDMENWFQRYVDCKPCATHFVICLREPGEPPIGEFYIACDDRPACVDVALLIGETSVWGQGYGREAVTAYAGALFASGMCGAVRMNARRNNIRVLRLCQETGFEVEYEWANGQFVTLILTHEKYALLHAPAQAGS